LLGLSVWCQDEAGPYQTKPYSGTNWRLQSHPVQQPHEYSRNGTAKVLTLFHPADGQLLVKGVRRTTNVIVHAWLKEQLLAILAQLPRVVLGLPYLDRLPWEHWREGLQQLVTLPAQLPPLRLLLIMDNLVGHKNPEWLLWCFSHGILPLFTPLGGSWLNMAESIQRLVKRRALDGTYPTSPQHIIQAFEAVAAHWNKRPTPFVWAGKRKARRDRAALKRHRLGASGAATVRPSRRRFLSRWSWQPTH
jgi:DDE superfamily endonuclease